MTCLVICSNCSYDCGLTALVKELFTKTHVLLFQPCSSLLSMFVLRNDNEGISLAQHLCVLKLVPLRSGVEHLQLFSLTLELFF